MKPRKTKYNAKRRLICPEVLDLSALAALGQRVRYGGNPEHKRNPGDFGLTPPAAPRRAKSLCDDAAIFRRRDALELLKKGIAQGLVSDRFDGGWPYNVWMVSPSGVVLEAQLEADGVYHGYPMPDDDPFRSVVLRRWRNLHE